jgi:hypothetical protein
VFEGATAEQVHAVRAAAHQVVQLVRELAEQAAAVIACASLADGIIDPVRLRRVVEYAHAMHVSEGWVRDVLQVARGHLA